MIATYLIKILIFLSKTTSPDILLLTFSNKYTAINNLKYLEKEQVNLMITFKIDPIVNTKFNKFNIFKLLPVISLNSHLYSNINQNIIY